MKRLLTIAAVLIGMAAAGQYPIYQRLPIKDTLPKYDTVAIVYLYCDTKGTSIVYWDFGYEVIEGKQIWRIGNDGSRTPLFKRIGYLDRHKQPIRKTMIIWQTKTINNGTN